MVFLTVARFMRMKYRGPNKGPDEYYRKRNIFRLSAHFYGRARNCYSIAVKKVHRALVYSTKGRKLKREDMRDLLLASTLFSPTFPSSPQETKSIPTTRGLLDIFHCWLSKTRDAFTVMALQLFNELPDSIKTLEFRKFSTNEDLVEVKALLLT